jgi:hypothetical protein
MSIPTSSNEYQSIEQHISKFIERIYLSGMKKNDPSFHVRIPIRKIQDINVYTVLVITHSTESGEMQIKFLIYTLFVYELKATKDGINKNPEDITEDDKKYYLLYTFAKKINVYQLIACSSSSSSHHSLESSVMPQDDTPNEISPEKKEIFAFFSRGFVTELFNELKDLRFSKCYNVFVKSEEYMDDYFNSMNDALTNALGDKYESIFQSCCICYEMTNQRTFCGHYLCIPCLDTLENYRCPMCRICLHCNSNYCDKYVF